MVKIVFGPFHFHDNQNSKITPNEKSTAWSIVSFDSKVKKSDSFVLTR
jgi:hypothetical protein